MESQADSVDNSSARDGFEHGGGQEVDLENDRILRNPYSDTSTSVIRCYEGSLEYLE